MNPCSRFTISRLVQAIIAASIITPAVTAAVTQDAASLMVAKTATVTILNAAPNPVKLGEPVKLTAKVEASTPLELAPTGTVSFYDDDLLLGTSALSQGKATLMDVVFSTKGKHKLIARYSGDANYDASSAKRLGVGEVTLLLHMEGADQSTVFKDSSNHDTENKHDVNGDLAHISIDQAHAGKASGWFDGTRQVSYPASANWDMGAGDFTVETWAMFHPDGIGSNTRQFLVGQSNGTGANSTFNMGKTADDRFIARAHTDVGVVALIDATRSVAADTWYHLAMVRHGDKLTLYVNGSGVDQQPIGGAIPARSTRFSVGVEGEYFYVGLPEYGTHMVGRLDDFRLTKTAVYTNDFTPPTQLPDPVMRVK